MAKSNYMAACSLALFACGGTSGSPPPLPDAGDVDEADAMPVNTCVGIDPAYGDLGAFTGTAVLAPTNPDIPDGQQFLSLEMPMNEDALPDTFFLELWADSPPFLDGGLAPASIEFTGDQSDLILCGACAYIAPDYEEGGLIDFHAASGGQLELTIVDPTPDSGRVQGTLRDIKLRQVTVDEAGQVVVAGGCKTEIAAIDFDFTVVAAPPETP